VKAAAIVILLVVALAGCKDARKDMAAQPKYTTYEPAEAFSDGASARPLPAGTVPRDPADVPSRAWGARENLTPVMSIDVARTDRIPFAVDSEVIARGQETFNVYCSVCHGRLGNGNGMVVRRGFPRPPSFHVDRLKGAPDSHFYNVIANGFGAMYGYGERVPPELRWEIVAYIRALQAAPDNGPGGATEADRKALIALGDRPTSIPAATTRPKGGPP
jgi:mono/diheme cytochrome c family protein